MLATAITHVSTETNARANGVAARRSVVVPFSVSMTGNVTDELSRGAEASRAWRPYARRARRIRAPPGEPTGTGRPRAGPEAAAALWTETDRAARTCGGRADHHAPVRIHADGLGLDARLLLHGEVHDPPLVREHRLEGHGLAAGLHPAGDATGDLAKLLLPPAAITLDVDRHVHRATDRLGRDGRDDLLERDEILPASTDECTEIAALDLEALHPRPIVERDLRIDAHLLEQGLEDVEAEGELLGECGRGLIGLVGHAIGGGPDGVGPARDLSLVDRGLGLLGALLLAEREEHARVDPAHAQPVRGLAALQDLDVHVHSLATELEQSALDGLLDRTPGELLTTKRHRVPRTLPRHAGHAGPCLLLPVAVPLATGLAGILRAMSVRRYRGLGPHVPHLLLERGLLPADER